MALWLNQSKVTVDLGHVGQSTSSFNGFLSHCFSNSVISLFLNTTFAVFYEAQEIPRNSYNFCIVKSRRTECLHFLLLKLRNVPTYYSTMSEYAKSTLLRLYQHHHKFQCFLSLHNQLVSIAWTCCLTSSFLLKK